MATQVFKKGGFVVIKTPYNTTQIPIESFVFSFVGTTDTVQMKSVENTLQPISEVWLNIQDENKNQVGTTKEAVEDFLYNLPVVDAGISNSVNIIGNTTDFSNKSKQDEIKAELQAIRAELQEIRAELHEKSIKKTFVISFSGKVIQDLGLSSEINPIMGEISLIQEHSTGSVVFEIDGNNPVDNTSPKVSGTASFNPIKNIDLRNFKVKGTNITSRYYVVYSTYK